MLMVALCWLENAQVGAEIIFHDTFTQGIGKITNSIPILDVEGKGWKLASPNSDLELDGQGHLFNATTNVGGSAGVPLIPIGPDGSITVSASIVLPVGSSDWVGFGLGNANQFLAGAASQSGPWLKVQGDGAVTLYGGSGVGNATTIINAYTEHR